MSVTIKDIANLAGVSKTTVSKVINNKDDSISKKTREKILAIMKEQNYTPNKLAQGLVTKKTNTIGLIIPDIRNPFFTDMSRGVEDYARTQGYNIIFSNTDDSTERELESILMLTEKMVDGIIFAPSSHTEKETKKHIELTSGLPIVLVDKDISLPTIKGIVKLDNKNGTYESTKHLIKQGHKEILYLSGPLKNDIGKERLNGYKRAFEKNDSEYKEENVVEGQYRYEWAYDFVKSLESINYTAICCANDLMAIGAIHALKERLINIPEDISIVGFDDIQTAKLIDPSLTTIKQPAYEMGQKASEILINSLKEKEAECLGTILFKPELVVRNSTKEI